MMIMYVVAYRRSHGRISCWVWDSAARHKARLARAIVSRLSRP